MAAGSLAYQNTLEANSYLIVGKPLAKLLYRMGFSKDDLNFGQALKTSLAAIIDDCAYDRLLRKWNLTDGASIQHNA